jgi:hypothetical protein
MGTPAFRTLASGSPHIIAPLVIVDPTTQNPRYGFLDRVEPGGDLRLPFYDTWKQQITLRFGLWVREFARLGGRLDAILLEFGNMDYASPG